ncbi:hypothetical protein SAMN06265365_11646 [Tistlia consotensis]|uniref:Universal stress protein family protein n=1 Tax=Tistlia consotensis USBA 355 TaxID=560819 RepID=A0A1Y6CEN5_9PROT|nr:hypothetical protein [Tistlia consotensis]SMF48490.1 hypothetical protein SAMN05428998_11791 [Tistlia consotensis USBA 355]SNR81141.1 hypothetical protein SAMN06265365_11646 [Tistlia consotensis]
MSDGSAEAPVFRRVVVGFRDASGSAAALEATARLAQGLRAELLGIFVEDLALLEWSASPLTGQVARTTSAAAPFTPDRLAEEFARAATVSRQRLSRAAARLGLTVRFRIERASAVTLQVAAAEPGDLLVVVEPTDPMARLSYPFAELLRSIAGTSAPVLFMPRAVSLRHGPVVAVTRGSDRPARSLAAALGEPLVSLAGPEQSLPLGHEAMSRLLQPLHEHLLVFDRPSLAAMGPLLFAELATERRVPALVVGETAP